MTLPRQHTSSKSLPAVVSKDPRTAPRPSRRELEREVVSKLREVQERAKEVTEGIKSGSIDINDLAE